MRGREEARLLTSGGRTRVMQLSALRYFLETARLGSIRRAAEFLYVAPSAVSRQIALLEQTYGMPLFERHAAGVRLTAAGEVFARQARATVRDFERLHSEIDDLQKLRRGTVRIASVEPTVATVVYRAIAEFARTYPGITYEVKVIGGISAIAALAAEECDVAISFEPPPHPILRRCNRCEVPSLPDGQGTGAGRSQAAVSTHDQSGCLGSRIRPKQAGDQFRAEPRRACRRQGRFAQDRAHRLPHAAGHPFCAVPSRISVLRATRSATSAHWPSDWKRNSKGRVRTRLWLDSSGLGPERRRNALAQLPGNRVTAPQACASLKPPLATTWYVPVARVANCSKAA